MAFFSQVNSLFNNQNQPRKSDALLAPVPGNDPNQNQPQQGGGLQLSKPSTSVQGGGDGGNKAEQGQAASQYTQVNPQGRGVAQRNIVESNLGTGTNKDGSSKAGFQAEDASKYGGNAIAKSKDALQQESNRYAQANVYQPQVQQADIDGYVKAADKGAFSKINGLLNGAPKPVAEFSYDNKTSDDNTQIHVKGLNTIDGRQKALRQQNADYSDYNDTGATIDALLLGQNADFKNQQADLVKQYGAYDQAKADAVQQSKGVQSRYADNAQAEKDSVTKYLSGSGDAMKAALQSRYDKSKVGRDNSISESSKANHSKADGIRDEFRKRVEGLGANNADEMAILRPTLGSFANNQGLPDLSQFLKDGTNTLGMADVTTADEAAQFQRINELLGRGDRFQTSGLGAGVDSSFDEGGYRAALDKMINPTIDQFNNLRANRKQIRVGTSDIASDAGNAIASNGVQKIGSGIVNALPVVKTMKEKMAEQAAQDRADIAAMDAATTKALNGNQGAAGSNPSGQAPKSVATTVTDALKKAKFW